MSVESTTLERSALEGKDRDELTTIAQALGGQIRPRARKAEIVQLILELTGVESSAGTDGGTPVPQDNAPDTATAPADVAPTEAAPAEPAVTAPAPSTPA